MLGVVKVVPVPKDVPPVALLYHLTEPALGVALKVTEPVPQRLEGVVLVTVGLAITVTALVVAEQPLVAVNVKVALPAETPVITPELLMVATAVLELDQVPEPRGIAEPAGGIILYGCPLGKLAVSAHLWAR